MIFSKKINKLALWGWWQGKNLGDRWIKSCMAKIFPDADFINTRLKNINDYSFVICGGGGLWYDSPIGPWNRKIKIPFGTMGLGAEFPHINEKARKLSRQAEFFFVRDKYSLDCMNIKNIAPSRDITFSFPLEWINSREDIDTEHLFFVFRDGNDFLKNPGNSQFKKFIEYGRYEDNKDMFDLIIDKKFKRITADDFQTEEDNAEERIAGCGFVISGRFHGIVMAIQKGLPCIAIDICPKIRALMQDCGLEEYIIKMDEVDKLPDLIDSAINNLSSVRERERRYREEAIKIIDDDIKMAKIIINKYINPDKKRIDAIHYGSYWMKENDVINTMSDDLGSLCALKRIDLKIYNKHKDRRIKNSIKTPNGHINYLNTELIIRDLKKFNPKFIILNCGGLVLEDEGFAYCKENGIITVGIALSDPDVYPHNGAVFAHKFDIFYTNSKYSLENQYNCGEKVHIKLLPFAASEKHHFYMPDVLKEYDIVVVGHARQDRLRIIEQLDGLKLGLYGNGWGKKGLGCVNGIDHVKAINSGKIYLSFAGTNAGYDNVKVGLFEAMACNTCVVVKHMDELENYFDIGKEVLCYKEEKDLIQLLHYYLTNESEREKIRASSYCRFLREHTYKRRWVMVLQDIDEYLGTN